MISKFRTPAAVLLVTALFAPPLAADVSSVDIVERRPVEDGRLFGDAGLYEEIVARITFAIDPADPVNQVIVNLDRAPRNVRGMVEATARAFLDGFVIRRFGLKSLLRAARRKED